MFRLSHVRFVILAALAAGALPAAPVLAQTGSQPATACPLAVQDLIRKVERKRKTAPYNPTSEMDNCVACTSAFLNNAFARSMEHTAETIEHSFGPAGIDQHFDLPSAIEYIQSATHSSVSPKPVAFMAPTAPPGFYAVFLNNGESFTHVVAAWVTPGGRRFVFDSQVGVVAEMKTVDDWTAFMRRYRARGGRPFLFTPNDPEK